jgi:PhnB protein
MEQTAATPKTPAQRKSRKGATAANAAATKTNEPTPAQQVPVKGGVIAYMTVSNASKAAEFYAKAFGAEEQFRYPVDEKGRTMHIHLYINGSSVMLSDAFPEYGHALQTPQSFSLHMMVKGIDETFQKAVDAGCEVVLPVQKMFWGDRYGQVRDPFGVIWAMGEPDTK